MKAMHLNAISSLDDNPNPLTLVDIPIPEIDDDELLIQVETCAVCHTEMDEIEGRTPPPRFPVVPGHQVVGTVIAKGARAGNYESGQRVGAAWIFWACGNCRYCLSDRENLCPEFLATGRDVDGGYAEYMRVPAKFAIRIPDTISSVEAAPFLCAGAIGYRSIRLSRISKRQVLGLTGFGSSGHLVLLLVRHLFPGVEVFVFARNPREREFALELGASWAGDIDKKPPEKCSAIIETTPVWKPVVESMRNLEPGGRLVINAIRKEEIDKEYLLRIDYAQHLWLEKEIKSVANVTRKDVTDFLDLAVEFSFRPQTQIYALSEANQALSEMKNRSIRGAKVLVIKK